MKKFLNKKTIPFILLFFIILYFHLFFTTGLKDDILYANFLKKYTYFGFLSYHYRLWSSRLIIESVLIVITNLNEVIWKILDSFLFTITAYIILLLVNKKQDTLTNYIGCFLLLQYPLVDLSSAGWIATTTNYVWTFSLGLLSFYPLIQRERGVKVHWLIYVFAVIGLLYSANLEQMCMVLFVFNLLYLVYNCFIKKEKLSKYNILCLLITFLMLIFIFTCPGNWNRYAVETAVRIPYYSDYGILDKAYLGIVPTFNILIANKIYLILFITFLAMGAYIYSKYSITKVIAISSAILVYMLTIFKQYLCLLFPNFEQIYGAFNSNIVPPFSESYNVIPIVLSILLICSIIYMIVVIFKKSNAFPFFIFILGFATRFIMGFSPTIFASSSRTCYFLYMAMIIIILYIFVKLNNDKKISPKWNSILTSVLFMLAMFNSINVLLSAL